MKMKLKLRIHQVVRAIPVILCIIMGIVVLHMLLQFWGAYSGKMNDYMNT